MPASRDDAFSYARTLSAATHVSDAKAFVAWLDAQKAVDTRRKIGTTGYCMGGAIVMRTAARCRNASAPAAPSMAVA